MMQACCEPIGIVQSQDWCSLSMMPSFWQKTPACVSLNRGNEDSAGAIACKKILSGSPTYFTRKSRGIG